MTEIRAFLVDLDGTLVATGAANARAYADALEEAGIACDVAELERVSSGRNWRTFLPVLMPGATGGEQARVAARKSVLYANRLTETVANAGLVALIRCSRETRRTALVTTASAASVRAILAHHDLGDLFDTVVTGDDVARHKPDPEAYRLAAARLNVRPEECLIFEDSDIGLAAAIAFGAPALRIMA